MLVLIRKIGETVAIGDDIRITVVDIDGRQVRLATEAPAAVGVLRQELHQRAERLTRERPQSSCRNETRRPVQVTVKASSRRGTSRSTIKHGEGAPP